MADIFNPLVEREYRDFAFPYTRFWDRWEFTANLAIYHAPYGIQYAYPVVYGPDLSQWNTVPNSVIASLIGDDDQGREWRFIMLKGSEGLTYEDPTFAPRWPVAVDAGLELFVYGFSRGNLSGPGQAANLLRVTETARIATNGAIKLTTDNETTDGATQSTIRQMILGWHQTVQAEYGESGQYSSPSKWQELTGNMTLPDDVFGHTAHWTSAANPWIPTGWIREKTRKWQIGVFLAHGWVPKPVGWPADKRVDVNVFFGTAAQLHEWFRGGNPPLELEVRVENLEAWQRATEEWQGSTDAAIQDLYQKVQELVDQGGSGPTTLTYTCIRDKSVGAVVVDTRADGVLIVDHPPMSEGRFKLEIGESCQVYPERIDLDGVINHGFKVYGREHVDGRALYMDEEKGSLS